MPRSSFADNPLLRVSRPVSACSRCRAAKVKCDGKLPACTACEKAGRESECSAANDQFARGKERSYVAALELRVEKLERRIEFARLRKASLVLHESDLPRPILDADRKDSMAVIRAAIHRKAARSRENSDVNSLISDFGYLSVNAATRDFEPSLSNMTFGRLVLAAATNDALPEARGTRFPPRQMAQSLIRYYMDNIFILYPFFSETSLLTALDNYYQEDRRHIKSSEHWLLYMVLAIASTAQSRSNKDDFYSQGVEFVGRAMDYADRALMPGYSTQIQSLILLTLYSVIDPAHFDSWLLIGFTCRAIVDLGLHQDPAPTQQADKTALDMRRKTFYCAFSLDRAISMIHARGVSFTDDSINVALPSSSGFGPIPAPKSGAGMTGPQPADPALLLFQLRRLQSEWYQRLFQANPAETLPDATAYVWQMCHEMRKWAEATMVNPNLPPAVRERFDLELRYSYVYCLAPSARTPHVTAYGRALIFEHAIAYVDRAFELVHSAAATAFYTYHDALRVYFMGSQFVAVLRDASDALLAADAALLVPLAVPGKAPPPSLPPRLADDLSDNLDRSLRCLGRVALTLEKYGERWSDALSLMQSFDLQSSELVRFLEARKAAASAARQQQPPPQTGLPPRVPVPMAPNQGLPMMVPVSIPMSVPPPPQQVLARGAMPMQFQSQRGEMTWADVDIDRIIRGSM